MVSGYSLGLILIWISIGFFSFKKLKKLAVVKLPNYTANVHIIYNACAVSIFFSRAVAAASLFYRLLVAVYCQILQLLTSNNTLTYPQGEEGGRKFPDPLIQKNFDW